MNNPELKVEYERTLRIAEALYRVKLEHHIDDQDFSHHIGNGLQGLRGVDFSEDDDETIHELCVETQKRLAPFLKYLRLLNKPQSL